MSSSRSLTFTCFTASNNSDSAFTCWCCTPEETHTKPVISPNASHKNHKKLQYLYYSTYDHLYMRVCLTQVVSQGTGFPVGVKVVIPHQFESHTGVVLSARELPVYVLLLPAKHKQLPYRPLFFFFKQPITFSLLHPRKTGLDQSLNLYTYTCTNRIHC